MCPLGRLQMSSKFENSNVSAPVTCKLMQTNYAMKTQRETTIAEKPEVYFIYEELWFVDNVNGI